MQDNIEKITEEILKNKGRIVALTGAGISEESGIPTFRGRGGLWDKYSPNLYANIGGLIATFIVNPPKVVNFFVEVAEVILHAEPNQGHLGLAELEGSDILKAIITQNIDNLHQGAGSKNVIELHGNAYQWKCRRCGKKYKLSTKELGEMVQRIKNIKISRWGLSNKLKEIAPTCTCGGNMRPDVVFFGELLPQDELDRAYNELEKCKLLLLVGTSGIVHPAASLPSYAKASGARIVEINKQPSSLTSLADYFIKGSAGVIIPSILERIGNN